MDKNKELIKNFDNFEERFMYELKNISHLPYVYIPYFEEKLHLMRRVIDDISRLQYEFDQFQNTLSYIYYICNDETEDKTTSFDFINCFALMNICLAFTCNFEQYNIKEE